MKKFDVCIVGAGVAGATMAAYLGKHGVSTAVIERNLSERDVIVGELLQPGGYRHLQEMALESFVEGIDAQPVYGYDVIYNNDECLVKYHKDDIGYNGFGFRNGRFVQNMRKHILENENITVIEGRVTSLLENENDVTGVTFQPKGEQVDKTIQAHLTIVSDGPISKFRNNLSNPEARVKGYFLGIILENCELPYPNHGHLVIGNHPPFVLYPVTKNEIRILIDFPGEQAPKINEELKTYLLDKFQPAMPEIMKEAFAKAVEKGGFKMMPNHRMAAAPFFKKGAVLVGDSLNMRHPLTGGGMTAAFSDVLNLGTQLIKVDDFSDANSVGNAVKTFYETRHQGNQNINILADGLYGVVNQPDLRDAFFSYIKRGGKYAQQPINILGGLNKDKKLLQKHFFGVANYGTRLRLRNGFAVDKIGGSVNMMKEAVRIISPLLLSEKPDAATRLLLKTLAKEE